jgi:hypothetical protein
MAEISLRKRYTLQITNTFCGPLDPSWKHAWACQGTPRQLVEEIQRWQRGGSDVACRITDSQGREISRQALLNAAQEAEILATWRD